MEIFNSGLCVLINALPCNYYAKEHIPNSYNLPYKDIKKMKQQELLLWFSEVIKENHSNLYSDQLNRSFVWGMSWFIFSEVMFFAAFFGALFYVRTFVVDWYVMVVCNYKYGN